MKNLAHRSSTFNVNNNGCSALLKTKSLSYNGYCCELSSDENKANVLGRSHKATFIQSKMPESSWNDVSPPTQGDHFATLFNNHRNDFKPVAVVNGCVKEESPATFNGFHDMEANKATLEKTVGHGRPRCHHSEPTRIRSYSESAPGSQGRCGPLYEGIQSPMKPGPLGTSRKESNGHLFLPMEIALLGDPSEGLQKGICPSEERKNVLLCYRQSHSPELTPQPGLFSATVDQHQSLRPFRSKNRSFPDFRKAEKMCFREEFVIESSETVKQHLEVAKERKLEYARVNDWNSCWDSLGDSSRVQEEEKIFELLRNNGPMAATDIAASTGFETENQVNHYLFYLYKKGHVKINGGSPPLWTLRDSFRQQCPRRPGVIGAERKHEAFIRRRNHSDDICERPRRHSFHSYESKQRQEPRVLDNTKPWIRSNGVHCPNFSERISPFFCKLCKLPFPTDGQFEEHLRSTKHQNKVAKYNAVPYKKFCEYCKVHLNSESQANEHFNSGRHEQTVAKSQKAPPKQHLPLVSSTQELNLDCTTRTEPYVYQLELHRKAMITNAVFFLPTGTGKTLVAALVIAHMLKLNPSRQVVFLVDRVLLVLQQSDYLRRELSHIQVADEGTSNSFNGTRPIRIGAVCGEMRKLEGNARIYEQDVLIITADCYRNHLNNGTLRFDDVSLIVLDEAHHCNKDHPYNVIIRDFYLREDDLLGHRPKVLGLTASPAGELSLDKTTKRLQRLLGNLGDAKLLNVSSCTQELDEKTTKALPECIPASYTQSEEDLKDILVEYVTRAFNMTVRLSEMKDYKDIFQPSSGGLFSIDDIHPVLRVIDNIVLSRPESNALSALLHFQFICEALCALQECGEQVALEHMTELAEEGCPHGFEWAKNMGLPSEKLCSYLEQYLFSGFSWRPDLAGIASAADQLVERLSPDSWFGANSVSSACVLVLVTRRRTAYHLSNYLSNSPELQAHGIRTAWLEGQRVSLDNEELAVFKHGEIVQQIRDGLVQIVVCTTASKESLDIPSCQMVVQMNPPSSAQALTQMRARGQAVRFVCISRNYEQAKKIEDLLRREDNMKRAVRMINGF